VIRGPVRHAGIGTARQRVLRLRRLAAAPERRLTINLIGFVGGAPVRDGGQRGRRIERTELGERLRRIRGISARGEREPRETR
jgi:hypothetical protein